MIEHNVILNGVALFVNRPIPASCEVAEVIQNFMETILFALLGLLIGVFVNRAADYLPPHRALSVTPNALRAPVVLIVNAVAFAFLWTHDGAGIQLLLHLIYTFIFLLVLVIDFEHRLILNVVILPATLFAALASPLSRLGVVQSLLGGAAAFAIVYVIYIFAQSFARLRRRNIAVPFGFGDVKLAGFTGLVTGFSALYAVLYAILLGGVGAILFLAYQLIAHRRLALNAAIPYGPFFCIAGWFVMVLGT